MSENKMNQPIPTVQLIELLQKKRHMGYTTLSSLFKRIKGQEDVMLIWVLQHPKASDEEIIKESYRLAGIEDLGNTLKGITQWLPEIENMTEFGKWHNSSGGFFVPNNIVYDLVCSFFEFMERNPAYKNLPSTYPEILRKNGLDYRNGNVIMQADLSQMDISCILSMFLSVNSAERMNPGVLNLFLRKGVILHWLKRLEELDDSFN